MAEDSSWFREAVRTLQLLQHNLALRSYELLMFSLGERQGDYYCLVYLPDNFQHYVTWYVNLEGDTSFGHYISNEMAAIEDLKKRSGRRSFLWTSDSKMYEPGPDLFNEKGFGGLDD